MMSVKLDIKKQEQPKEWTKISIINKGFQVCQQS